MSPRLPQFIDPLRLTREGTKLEGRLPLAPMARLQLAVYKAAGEVEFRLEFGRETDGVHSIMGNFSASVSVICQRCLQPMDIGLEGDVRLGIVHGEQEAAQLPAAYEPLEVAAAEPLKLQDLIEDELLLALPVAPRHLQACLRTDTAVDDPVRRRAADRQYPFAGLAAIKRSKE